MKNTLKHDPIPWLMTQQGEAAVRARRSLRLDRDGDAELAGHVTERAGENQLSDGSFDHSPMKTAGMVCLLTDLDPDLARPVVSRAAEFLIRVLAAQPGYGRARDVRAGALTTPCDLGGFFGPYDRRSDPDVVVHGAHEMNFLREFEPLLGPKSPVRTERRSSLDRAGPSSCYSWGLVPLCYIAEALCRGGFYADQRLVPAVNVLLGAQRQSGGWCRNLGGAFNCTIPALRALGAHPVLRDSREAEAALRCLRSSQCDTGTRTRNRWRGSGLFLALEAAARFRLPSAEPIIVHGLTDAARLQLRNGTFGTPCRVERVAAVVAALRRSQT